MGQKLSVKKSYMTTVLGVDPGLHTGLCMFDMHEKPDEKPIWGPLKGVQIAPRVLKTEHDDRNIIRAFSELLELALSEEHARLNIVCEHFVFTRVSTMGGSRNAIEMTGALKAVIQMKCDEDPSLASRIYYDDTQKPADAKLVRTPMLMELGIRRRGDGTDDHAHMAARHALALAAKIRRSKHLYVTV